MQPIKRGGVMNKQAILAVVLLIVAGGGAWLAFKDRGTQDSSAGGESQQVSTETTQQPAAEFSESDVAMHATRDDCWTIISDKVYDITSYIPRHPGGSEILRACGTDGTTLFTTRTSPNGDAIGSGTAHSSLAQSQLQDFFKGNLK